MSLFNLLITLVLVVFAFFLFRRYYMVYEYIFFTGKAIQMAFWKTVLMLGLLFILFWGADWLLGLLLNPGYLHSALAFLVPSILFDIIDEPVSYSFDRAIGL
jgi:hypothetical protein